MSTLDKAIELVEITPLPDHEDIQLQSCWAQVSHEQLTMTYA
jgi:hypothetical protein